MDRRTFMTTFVLGAGASGLVIACGGQAAPAEKKAETKPADAKPADAKPADTKPADTKPADTKPADAKPADAKPAAATGGAVAADVPLFKDAKPFPANDPMAAAMESVKENLKKQPEVNMTVDAFVLPSGATFDQVKQYYGDELTKRGWKNSPAASDTKAGASMASWLKDDNKVFFVMFMPNPTQSGGNVMFVGQGTKK